MRIVGLDPGPEMSGWALLVDGHYIDGGHVPNYETDWQADWRLVEPDRIYIEVPVWQGMRSSNRHVVGTFLAAGELWGLGYPASNYVTPSQWRSYVTGKFNAGDKEILASVKLKVPGFPDLHYKVRSHIADAVGVALFGGAGNERNV